MRANIKNRTIEMTKVEAKAAGKITSEKFKELKSYKEAYPDFEVVIVAASRKKSAFSKLTYEYMAAYIEKHDNTKMAKFNELRGIVSDEDKEKFGEVSNKLEKAAYATIKKWFLNTFPEIRKFHEDHKEEMEKILKAA